MKTALFTLAGALLGAATAVIISEPGMRFVRKLLNEAVWYKNSAYQRMKRRHHA